MQKRCSLCKHFDRYYIKGTVRFYEADLGWCNIKKCCLEFDDTCERFVKNHPHKNGEVFLKCYVSQLLTEVSTLRKILEADKKAENDDEKNLPEL